MDQEQKRQAARQLKGNPLLDELLQELRRELLDAWPTTAPAEAREKLWQEVNALENARERIQSRITELVG